MAIDSSKDLDGMASNEVDDGKLDEMLYSAHAAINSPQDLMEQRATSIPALFSTIYKFIQNPSSVSVDTFKRMIDTDDTIGSGVDFLTTCLAARLGPYTHPNKEITAWVNDRLAQIRGGWFNTVKEVLSASWAGFSVTEKVWKNDPRHGFVPHKLITLPPTTVMFETERTGELTSDGILQYQRNWSPLGLASGQGFFGGVSGVGYGFSATNDGRPDPFARFGDLPFPVRVGNTWQYLSIRIPTQKCIHYSFDAQGKFGNPYGRSLLRRCYKYYILKDSTLQMLATALDRKGTPLLVVYADPNTTVQDSAKVAGRTENMRGQRVGTRADQAAAAAFSRIHNDSVIVLPGKKGQIYEVEMMAQSSNQEAFIATLDFCNKSIMRALLIPSLIFTNGDGTGSYALGQEHAKTFLKILDGMLEGVDDVLLESLVQEMLAYNFPRDVWEKDGYGKFTRRDFSDENLERLSQIWDRAIQNGIIDPGDKEDLNRMRDTLGFPEIERNPMESVPGQVGDNDMGIVGDDDRIERGPQAGELEMSKEDEGYNGAQVTAILDVLERVSTGLLSDMGAVNLLITAFQMKSEQAHAIVNGVQKNAPIPTGETPAVDETSKDEKPQVKMASFGRTTKADIKRTAKIVEDEAKWWKYKYRTSNSDKGVAFVFDSEKEAQNVYKSATRKTGVIEWVLNQSGNIIHVDFSVLYE